MSFRTGHGKRQARLRANPFAVRAWSPLSHPTRVLLLAGFVVLCLTARAHGADDVPENPDVLNTAASLSFPVRVGVYGLLLLGLCLLARVVPDAPLLCFVFSMPLMHFTGLRVGLTLMQCGIVLLKTRDPRLFLPSWPLSLLLVCIVASASWALDPHEALHAESTGIVAMASELPLALGTMACLRANLTSVERLLWTLVLGSAPGCVKTIQNAMAGIRYVQGPDTPDVDEYYMGFIAPDVFSTILVISGLFLVFCLISPHVSGLKKGLAGLLLPLFCVALMLAGIRSGWIAFAFGALPMLARTRNVTVILSVCAVAMVVALLGFSGVGGLNLQEKMAARVSEKSLSSGEARVEFWEIAGRGFAHRPILGIGWGCFPGFAADATVGRAVATHNIYVRLACELGLVGLGLFGVWMLTALVRVGRSAIGALGVLLMLSVLVQGLFLDHFLANHFWFFLGLCDGLSREHPLSAVRELDLRGAVAATELAAARP